MQASHYLLQAALIGFALSAPIGPIGLLCIQKTLELGWRGGLLVGLGAALGDIVYGSIAAFGLAAISNFLLTYQVWIKILGGILLLGLAYKEARVSLRQVQPVPKPLQGRLAYQLVFKVFCLTVTSPMTILSFIGIFASITCSCQIPYAPLLMLSGIFMGSFFWWLILTGSITAIKHKLPPAWIRNIRKVSCLILVGFGLYALVGGLWPYMCCLS
jgi:putative LysE/RhtB family amino acid efflux pump